MGELFFTGLLKGGTVAPGAERQVNGGRKLWINLVKSWMKKVKRSQYIKNSISKNNVRPLITRRSEAGNKSIAIMPVKFAH